jgi:hypothetical protein
MKAMKRKSNAITIQIIALVKSRSRGGRQERSISAGARRSKGASGVELGASASLMAVTALIHQFYS